MRLIFLFCLMVYLFIAGCAAPPVQKPAYQLAMPTRQVDYLHEVKPILEKRCVVCHSCYNSPCQLKMSSWEGLERGASKEQIYNAGRLQTMEPSRLFIDARSTSEWRSKGFFSVLHEEEQSHDESMMYMLLEHKRLSPDVEGDYYPEASDLTCSENTKELTKYLKKHPNRGMPFGFPPLKNDEFNTVVGWLAQGAKGPTEEQQRDLKAVAPMDEPMIVRWEKFLNRPEAKYRMTARYLYEHLFLAHVTFRTGSNEFFELVRSVSPPGQDVDVIATVRPYDDPGVESFYYRFRKIHSTLVHKTHMVFSMEEAQLQRAEELFILPEWQMDPHVVGYEKNLSANPFKVFEQIPAKSRYQWLLDNANYVIMTFIRGPVCKGQVALNVINDHFWLMFLDPEYDLAVKYPGFIKLNSELLRMPGENGSDYKLLKALLKNKHYKFAIDYYKARGLFYGAHYPGGLQPDFIWKGNKPTDAPVLTVYRHFDSASVHRGVLGNMPRTAWVIDYPLFERIYYSLVAGFDVYGTAGHQLATRLYMDALRIEGESYFLDFLPREVRQEKMSSWYQKVDESRLHYHPVPVPAGYTFNSTDPQREFLELIIEKTIQVKDIAFDHNYLRQGETYPELPDSISNRKEFLQGFISTTAPGGSFFRHVADHNANGALIRIKNIPEHEDIVASAVVNRWHDNVKFLFQEKFFLNPEKDQVNIISGFVGSYPNYFFEVEFKDLHDFLSIVGSYDGSMEDQMRLNKYGVNRAQEDFWEVYDWFQESFNREHPETAGLADLNRYYFRADAR